MKFHTTKIVCFELHTKFISKISHELLIAFMWFPWTSQLFQNCVEAVSVGDHPNDDFEREIEKVYLFCAKYVGDMLEPLSKYGELKEKKQQSYLIMRILQERNLYLHGDYAQ